MRFNRTLGRDIDLFMQGASSVTRDRQRIRTETLSHIGNEYTKLVDYLLLVQSECLTEAKLAELLIGRDMTDGFLDSEIEAAKRAGLVIVSICDPEHFRLYGAVEAECDSYPTQRAHLIRTENDWQLIRGGGYANNLELFWYEQGVRTRMGEEIPRTFETDIPGAEPFLSMRDGEVYCRSLVFSVARLNGDIVA
ncbi:MAG: hypothetical protein IJ242_09000 [Clostridia bacterium]|nr:hypothetical protein [Clostridia bacterium]